MRRNLLLDQTVIAGAGESEHVRGTDKSERQLTLEAAVQACRDAQIEPETIDGLAMSWHQTPSSEDYVAALGIRDLKYHTHSRAGGASQVAMLLHAAAAVTVGLASRVVVAFGWNRYSGAQGRAAAPPPGGPVSDRLSKSSYGHEILRNLLYPAGVTVAMQDVSLHANRWVHEVGGDLGGMATIALAQREHAHLNPSAYMYGRRLDFESYEAAPYLTKPFRKFDCCLETDGAAAVVVMARTDPAVARGNGRSVFIAGGAEGHPDTPDDITTQRDVLAMGITKAAPRALDAVGVAHDEIDFVEVYDCFTFIALRQLEEMGFCERGEGSEFVRGGRISIGGELPMNTHGGLLSHSYVAGMTHITEAVRQLRGEAGAAQVKGAHLGLVTGYGNYGSGSLVFLHN